MNSCLSALVKIMDILDQFHQHSESQSIRQQKSAA